MLATTMQLFSVLGDTPQGFEHSKFKCFLTPHWQTPSFSPIILLPGNTITESDIEYLESYFERNPIQNTALKTSAYFTYIHGEDLYDLKSIEAACAKAGWEIDPDPLAINLIYKMIPLNFSADIYINIQDPSLGSLSTDYENILRTNFNANEEYLKKVKMVFQQAKAYSRTVLIKHKNGELIAGGTVSMHNEIAFLTWGAVNNDYRNQGFHQLLLATCKMVATSNNIPVCGLATRNKFIRGKADKLIEMFICRKKRLTLLSKG